MSSLEGQRTASCDLWPEYELEFDGAPPPVPVGSMFSEGGDEVNSIPSILSRICPSLHLSSSSRVSTADSFRLSSLDSFWMSTMADHISSRDWVIAHLLDGETGDPTSCPKHAEKMVVKSAVLPPDVTPEKPAEMPLEAHPDVPLEYVDMDDIKEMDFLPGRGGKVNNHPGNIRYRNVVSEMKDQYKTASRMDKTALSKAVVNYVHSYGGRFLKKDKDGRYFIMTDAEARKKASQALRQ